MQVISSKKTKKGAELPTSFISSRISGSVAARLALLKNGSVHRIDSGSFHMRLRLAEEIGSTISRKTWRRASSYLSSMSMFALPSWIPYKHSASDPTSDIPPVRPSPPLQAISVPDFHQRSMIPTLDCKGGQHLPREALCRLSSSQRIAGEP